MVSTPVGAMGDKKESMGKTEKQINTLIESEDSERFNQHKFTGTTRELMLKVLHLAAREDMSFHNGGPNYVIDNDFRDLLIEYKKSVRNDLKPLIEDVQNTNFAI